MSTPIFNPNQIAEIAGLFVYQHMDQQLSSLGLNFK